MDYPSEFENIRKIFKYLGFEPFSHRTAIFRFNVIFLILHVAILIRFRIGILYTFDSLSEICDTLKVVSLLASWLSEIFIIWKNPKIQADIEENFNQLSLQMEEFYVKAASAKQSFLSKYVWKFYIIALFHISRVLLEFIVSRDEQLTVSFNVFAFYSMFYCLFKQTHILYYTDLLNYHFDTLIEQIEYLKELFECNTKLMNAKYEKFLVQKMQLSQKYYQTLRKTKNLINSWCDPFLLVHHLKIVIFIFANFYWMIYRLRNQKDLPFNFIVIVCTLELCSHLVQLTLLAGSCDKLVAKNTLVAYHIHSIDITKNMFSDRNILMDLIENFSIDILNSDPEFSAMGYFTIGSQWLAGVSIGLIYLIHMLNVF